MVVSEWTSASAIWLLKHMILSRSARSTRRSCDSCLSKKFKKSKTAYVCQRLKSKNWMFSNFFRKKFNFPNQKVYIDRMGNHEHMWNIFHKLSILSYKELS